MLIAIAIITVRASERLQKSCSLKAKILLLITRILSCNTLGHAEFCICNLYIITLFDFLA